MTDIVDRDGVGDAFVTGFLLAHLAGQEPDTCMRAGHLVASRVLRHAGPRVSGCATAPTDDQAVANEASSPTSTKS